MSNKIFQATGRRKVATATAFIKMGTGKFIINTKSLKEYFELEKLIITVKKPLLLTSSENSYDIKVKVRGGGTTGQADATKLAIARALILVNPKFRPILKKEGLLKRDPRKIERKKYGQPKARKKFQFSKR